MFVVGLEAKQHQHLRPQVAFALALDHRAEVAVGPLTGQRPFQPDFRLGNHLRAVEQVGGAHVALEPVRQFFPAVLALAVFAQPGVIFLGEPHADFTQIARQSVGLTLYVLQQPTAGFHAAHG